MYELVLWGGFCIYCVSTPSLYKLEAAGSLWYAASECSECMKCEVFSPTFILGCALFGTRFCRDILSSPPWLPTMAESLSESDRGNAVCPLVCWMLAWNPTVHLWSVNRGMIPGTPYVLPWSVNRGTSLTSHTLRETRDIPGTSSSQAIPSCWSPALYDLQAVLKARFSIQKLASPEHAVQIVDPGPNYVSTDSCL